MALFSFVNKHFQALPKGAHKKTGQSKLIKNAIDHLKRQKARAMVSCIPQTTTVKLLTSDTYATLPL